MNHIDKVREALDELHDLLVLTDDVSVRALMQFDKVFKYAEAAIQAHEAEVKQEVAELEADAKRYQWLRKNCQYGFDDHDGPQLIHRNGETGPHQNPHWREDLDAAVDELNDGSNDQ